MYCFKADTTLPLPQKLLDAIDPPFASRSQLEYTNAAIHEIHRRANIAAAGVPHGTVQDTQIGKMGKRGGKGIFF